MTKSVNLKQYFIENSRISIFLNLLPWKPLLQS